MWPIDQLYIELGLQSKEGNFTTGHALVCIVHEKPLILIKSRPKNNDMSKILIYFPLQGQFGSHFRFPCLNALEGNFLSCAIDFISGGDLKCNFYTLLLVISSSVREHS